MDDKKPTFDIRRHPDGRPMTTYEIRRADAATMALMPQALKDYITNDREALGFNPTNETRKQALARAAKAQEDARAARAAQVEADRVRQAEEKRIANSAAEQSALRDGVAAAQRALEAKQLEAKLNAEIDSAIARRDAALAAFNSSTPQGAEGTQTGGAVDSES